MIRSLLFWFLDDFGGNANISVRTKKLLRTNPHPWCVHPVQVTLVHTECEQTQLGLGLYQNPFHGGISLSTAELIHGNPV